MGEHYDYWGGDAAAVPVPDAGDDTLRLELAETIWLTAKGHLRQDESATVADALLPRIREHIAAAVQAERERAERCEEGRELERTALRNAARLIQASQAALARVEAVLAQHWDWKAGRSLHKAIRTALDGTGATDE